MKIQNTLEKQESINQNIGNKKQWITPKMTQITISSGVDVYPDLGTNADQS